MNVILVKTQIYLQILHAYVTHIHNHFIGKVFFECAQL